jgi:gluconate 2-dehydrogenase gamma chain
MTIPLSRRNILSLAAGALAVPGAREFFSAWLEAGQQAGHGGHWQPPEPPLLRNYTPTFFSAGDFEALQAFTEILIPTDETPGAREARCAHFIDFVLDASSEAAPDTQRQWRAALAALKELGFHAANAQGRAALVEAMSRPERDRGVSHPGYAAYRLIKQQTTFAYYTSRAGLIEALDYRGNSYNLEFPACTHPEHQQV